MGAWLSQNWLGRYLICRKFASSTLERETECVIIRTSRE